MSNYHANGQEFLVEQLLLADIETVSRLPDTGVLKNCGLASIIGVFRRYASKASLIDIGILSAGT